MQISSKGEYGARALLDLALHHDQGPVQTRDIARRQDIPKLYLNQLLITLRKAGLITSKRGSRGGHTLARHPAQINLAEAVIALEGSMAPIACVDERAAGECRFVGQCALRQIWQQVEQITGTLLENTTLEDLRRIQEEIEGRVMYYI